MRYFVISNDDRLQREWQEKLEREGYDVADEYDTDAVVVSLGGDGTILYVARNYPEATILPVRTGRSEGNRAAFETENVLEALERLETGNEGEEYTITRHRKLAAYRDGKELCGRFGALNEIGLHHSTPELAAVFAVRIRDRGETFEFERVIGDGVLVATPFGSTGYYRSVTRGVFSSGIGVAFNNVHKPMDVPKSVHLSEQGVVELELLEKSHASSAVLTRDNDEQSYELETGVPVEVRLSDRPVELVSVE